MKRIILITMLLSSTIWLQASVNVIIAYTRGNVANENSALEIENKFAEIYTRATIQKVATMDEIISAFNNTADTLIFYFVGHSNKVEGKDKIEYMGSIVICLNWDIDNSDNLKQDMLVKKSLSYLLSKNTATTKLVIIDGCYSALALDKKVSASWLFATSESQGGMEYPKYSLFSRILCDNITKNQSLYQLQKIINTEYLNKDYYPQFNSKVVISDEYEGQSIEYPLNSISINNFKF